MLEDPEIDRIARSMLREYTMRSMELVSLGRTADELEPWRTLARREIGAVRRAWHHAPIAGDYVVEPEEIQHCVDCAAEVQVRRARAIELRCTKCEIKHAHRPPHGLQLGLAAKITIACVAGLAVLGFSVLMAWLCHR